MRLNWMITPGQYLSMNDVHQACNQFYTKYQVVPDTIKFTYADFTNFFAMFPSGVLTLERGKEYGQFLAIPGGFVELCVLEQTDEAIGNVVGQSFFVVESTQIDREFEKHVLNKDDK